ncbi:hypothetical protein EKD16_01970 [Streptomonospora litoralis]|uniref:Uncharacterized protein n=1 Tax=Streptomonospora litoralis TaxID=2498135 RepID=A0A4P6PX12_9ACTN|nr:hypothetical protein EKD16_01970 [Streptomonospora litoralis]
MHTPRWRIPSAAPTTAAAAVHPGTRRKVSHAGTPPAVPTRSGRSGRSTRRPRGSRPSTAGFAPPAMRLRCVDRARSAVGTAAAIRAAASPRQAAPGFPTARNRVSSVPTAAVAPMPHLPTAVPTVGFRAPGGRRSTARRPRGTRFRGKPEARSAGARDLPARRYRRTAVPTPPGAPRREVGGHSVPGRRRAAASRNRVGDGNPPERLGSGRRRRRATHRARTARSGRSCLQAWAQRVRPSAGRPRRCGVCRRFARRRRPAADRSPGDRASAAREFRGGVCRRSVQRVAAVLLRPRAGRRAGRLRAAPSVLRRPVADRRTDARVPPPPKRCPADAPAAPERRPTARGWCPRSRRTAAARSNRGRDGGIRESGSGWSARRASTPVARRPAAGSRWRGALQRSRRFRRADACSARPEARAGRASARRTAAGAPSPVVLKRSAQPTRAVAAHRFADAPRPDANSARGVGAEWSGARAWRPRSCLSGLSAPSSPPQRQCRRSAGGVRASEQPTRGGLPVRRTGGDRVRAVSRRAGTRCRADRGAPPTKRPAAGRWPGTPVQAGPVPPGLGVRSPGGRMPCRPNPRSGGPRGAVTAPRTAAGWGRPDHPAPDAPSRRCAAALRCPTPGE